MNVLDELACQVVKCSNHPGNRPYAAVAPWHVAALYFNANTSGVADPLFLVDGPSILRETQRDHGLAPCVYFVVPKDATGGGLFAEKCSAAVTALDKVQHVAAVMFDNEKVPLSFQDEFLPRWDQLRPMRPTLYSVEPIQDETVNRYALMLRRNDGMTIGGHWYPPGRVRKVTFQCYQGGMQPLDPYSVRRAQFGTARVATDELCPTIDPAQPAAYIGSALACGTRGAVLFESGRIRT